jgi:hypothetical protein
MLNFIWRPKVALFELLKGEIEAGAHIPGGDKLKAECEQM